MTDYNTLYNRSFFGATGSTNISSNTISGTTNIYQFIDDSGNVTQISKIKKNKFKHYIDAPEKAIYQGCMIGVSDSDKNDLDQNIPCTYGIALGLGDNNMGLASYE